TGRWEEASARLAEVPDSALTGGAAIQAIFPLAELAVGRGRLADAEHALALGARFEKSADVQERSALAACKAIVRRGQGRYEEALTAAEQAIEATELLGWGSQNTRAGLVEGIEAALALGELDRAEQLVALIEARPAGAAPLYLRGQAARLRARLDPA